MEVFQHFLEYRSKTVIKHSDINISKEIVPNLNTLEPELLRANSRAILNVVLDKNLKTAMYPLLLLWFFRFQHKQLYIYFSYYPNSI